MGVPQSLSARLADAQQHLAAADAVMDGLIQTWGNCRLGERARDPFDTLVNAIVGQQLSVKAAETIAGRVRAAAECPELFEAEPLLGVSPETLRDCGLSRAKVRYTLAAAQAQVDGSLDWSVVAQADDEAAIAHLTKLPGVGRWTAEMLLIFAMHRLDIYALGDLGLRRSIERLYRRGKPLTNLALKRITNKWRPYRSVASWYLWRDTDGDVDAW